MNQDELINYTPSKVDTKESSTLGLVAFLLSLAGLIAFGFVLGVAALICGIVALQDKNKKHGLATAAVVIGGFNAFFCGYLLLTVQSRLFF